MYNTAGATFENGAYIHMNLFKTSNVCMYIQYKKHKYLKGFIIAITSTLMNSSQVS